MTAVLHSTPDVAAPSVRAASGARAAYVVPVLQVLGTFQALTQSRTCAKNYNDGSAVGCTNSAKKT